MRRLCALLAGSLAATVLLAPSAAAQEADADDVPVTGFWSRTTLGAPSPVEAPVPVVPEGGTFVAGRGGSTDDERSGALAVSALRLLLPDDVQASAVTLEVADVRGEPVVAVCPATSFWEPVQGGRFEDAPTADCTQAATGTVQDGRLVVPLDGLASPGTLDVVLLPAVGAAFSLTLQPATAESVTTVPLSAASPELELAPASRTGG
jgi:hypothetical protein